jgi:DNA mismatch repair ATPase MutS
MRDFLLAATETGLGFDRVWAMVEPAGPLGREEKARARPFLPGQEAALEVELARVDSARRAWDRAPALARSLHGRLGKLRDLKGSVAAAVRGAALDVVELYEVKRLVRLCAEIDDLLTRLPWERPAELGLRDLSGIIHALDPLSTGSPGFFVGDEFSVALARVRRRKRACEMSLTEERREQATAVARRVGREPGPGGELAVAADEVEQLAAARQDPVLLAVREAGEYVYFRLRTGPRAREAEELLAHLREQERQEEAKVRARLSRSIARRGVDLLHNLGVLGKVDFLFARARLAREMDGTRPTLRPSGTGLAISEGRHPVVEAALKATGRRFTPLTVELEPGAAVLTGPNMGGKTVALRTVGVVVAMAQMGLMVPGRLAWSPVAFIFYGGQEEESRPGLSAFALEVTRLREPLARRDEVGLLLLDEFARGTNPREGRALSAAVLQQIAASSSCCFLATHHSGLAELVGIPHWQTRGLHGETLADVHPDDGAKWLYEHMDYRLERVSPGTGVPREALLVAKLLGLDEEVVALAETYLQARGSESEGGGR